MFTFKKCSKRLKRTVCVALCLIVLSSLLVLPAGAAQTTYTGNFTYVVKIDNSRYRKSVSTPHTGGSGGTPVVSGAISSGSHTLTPEWDEIQNLGIINGSIGVYYSFYYEFPGATSLSVSRNLSELKPAISYFTSSEATEFKLFDTNGQYVKFSVPQKDGSMMSPGWVFKARSPYIESINPVTDVTFYPSLNGAFAGYEYNYTSTSNASPLLYSPSATIIISDVVTLEWMEGLADSLTGDSDVLTAMYADVMSILNDMYSVMQDQLAVERAIKGYFEELLPLIESIDGTTSNIYSLLQTQFQLLRTLIATESGNIQDAIEQQTQDLIAYFDTVLSGSIGSMPEKSDDLESSVGNVSDAESYYQSSAMERFDQLAGSFNGFSGGTLGGVTLAATLFSRVWTALGEYSIVYSWPLLLGLCLVVIGRLSRLSGGQSSSVNNRGDSDA